jgi:hypothetical protein
MTTLEKLEELIYRGFKETTKSFQEAAQRFQETDRRFQETERLLKENAQRQREELRAELSARRIESDKQLNELKKQLAGITSSLGLFAESTVQPSVIRLFGERGIKLTGIYPRLLERRNGDSMEVDIVGAGPDAVVVIEVKLRLELEDVKEFLQRLPRFFEFFSRFRGSKLYGAVAGMSVDDSMARYAYKRGLFVLAQSGDHMQILNDEKFVPRVFGEKRKIAARRKS